MIFLQINILERRDFYAILMGRISITISYLSRCLTTETEKNINENSFIEDLAASKIQYVGTERQTHAIINNIGYVHFACSEEVSCPAQKM